MNVAFDGANFRWGSRTCDWREALKLASSKCSLVGAASTAATPRERFRGAKHARSHRLLLVCGQGTGSGCACKEDRSFLHNVIKLSVVNATFVRAYRVRPTKLEMRGSSPSGLYRIGTGRCLCRTAPPLIKHKDEQLLTFKASERDKFVFRPFLRPLEDLELSYEGKDSVVGQDLVLHPSFRPLRKM